MASILGGLGGGTLGEVLVAVGLDTKQLDQGLAKVKLESEGAGQSISKFGLAAKASFAIAAVAAVGFAAEAVKAAIAHEQVLTKLEGAIHGNTDALEEQAKATAVATGFNEDQILSLDVVAARFNQTGAGLKDFTAATLDYARATGKDAVTAAELLGKASLGSARALKVLGINFKATGDQGKDMATVLGLVEDKVGGQAAAFAKTYAGQMQILGARFHEVEVEVGEKLLPVLKLVIPILGAIIANIAPIVAGFVAFQVATAAAGIAAKTFGVELIAFAPEIIAATAGVALLVAGLTALGATMKAVTAFMVDQVNKLVQLKVATELSARTGLSLAESQKRVESTVGDATQALRDQKTAEDALAGGMVGLIAAVDQLRAAQRQLNKDRRDASTTAQQLRTDELAVLQAQLGVTGSLKDLIAKQIEAGASSQDVIDKFVKLGQNSHLTGSEIRRLIATVNSYIARLNAIPDNVVTRVDLIGNTTGDFIPHGQGGGNGQGNGGGGGSSPQQGDRGVHVHLHQPTFVGVPSASVIDAIHAGLVRKGRRTGSLQLT